MESPSLLGASAEGGGGNGNSSDYVDERLAPEDDEGDGSDGDDADGSGEGGGGGQGLGLGCRLMDWVQLRMGEDELVEELLLLDDADPAGGAYGSTTTTSTTTTTTATNAAADASGATTTAAPALGATPPVVPSPLENATGVSRCAKRSPLSHSASLSLHVLFILHGGVLRSLADRSCACGRATCAVVGPVSALWLRKSGVCH